MLLPELEASIETLLSSLSSCSEEIALLQVPSETRLATLRDAVCSYLRSEHEDAKGHFHEQCTHMRALRSVSPLTSPMTMPVLPKKLSGLGSPELSYMKEPGPSSVSTRSSPEMPEFTLEEFKLDEDSEAEDAPPFAAVMS
ncbi:unnamed protein product [Effrenium voratum]|nr:unnamed protein product [Effrenium voratum]